jgi:regulator of sigma E protease
VVILAGVTMNLVFAWVAYTSIALIKGAEILPTTRVGQVVTAGLPESVQPVSALQPGDSIVAINGRPVENWNDVNAELLSASGREVVVRRAGKPDVTVPVHGDALEERMALGQAVQPWQGAVVGLVQPGSPAAKAGLVRGDTVLAVNGEPVSQWYDMVDLIRPHPRDTLTLALGRASGREAVTVVPEAVKDTLEDGSDSERGMVGIGPERGIEHRSLSFGAALAAGTHQTISASTLIIRTVRGIFTARVSSRSLGGPILIAQLAGESAQLGWDVFVAFMALISVNLAVLNLLPIPVLDGGQFLFLVAEGIQRKPLSLKVRERLTAVGLVMIVLLMVFVFSNDILRLVGI